MSNETSNTNQQNDEQLSLFDIASTLNSSGAAEERWIAETLLNYNYFSPETIGLEATVVYLGTAVNDPEMLARQRKMLDATTNLNVNFSVRFPEKAYEWGKQFLEQLLKELRKIICSENANPQLADYKHYPKAIAVALSTVVMTKLGITEPMALGVSTLVLLSLSQATKNAFCTMTDEEVLKAIDEKSGKRKSRRK